MSDSWDEYGDDFEVDSGDMSAEDVDKGGLVELEGEYHVEFSEVINELAPVDSQGRARTPAITFALTVLESVPGQSPAGTRHFHRLYFKQPMSEGGKKMVCKFGLRTGVLKQVEGKIVDAATGSPKWTPKVFTRLLGQQSICKIKTEKGGTNQATGQQYDDRLAVPFQEFFQVDDPAVAHIPKDRKSLEAIGKGHAVTPAAAAAAAGEGGAKSSAPAQKPADDLPDDF